MVPMCGMSCSVGSRHSHSPAGTVQHRPGFPCLLARSQPSTIFQAAIQAGLCLLSHRNRHALQECVWFNSGLYFIGFISSLFFSHDGRKGPTIFLEFLQEFFCSPQVFWTQNAGSFLKLAGKSLDVVLQHEEIVLDSVHLVSVQCNRGVPNVPNLVYCFACLLCRDPQQPAVPAV